MDPEIPTKESHITSHPHASFESPLFMPLEIWVHIFMLSLPPVYRAQRRHKTVLALVCRLWNTIVESTPILWTRISIADTIAYVKKSLLKSGGHPIDVYGACPDPGRPWGYEPNPIGCRFLQEVNCHARRWRHVALQVMCEEGYAPLITVFPWLESLQLHSNQFLPVGEEYIALLNNERTPYLRKVMVHTAMLTRWNISFPHNLSKLEIQDYLPPSFELLSILATCPNLVVLRLGNFYHRRNDGSGSLNNSAPVVELAALQELNFHLASVPEVRGLLTHLKFPETCAISLGLGVSRDSALDAALWTPPLSLYHERFQQPGQISHVTVFVGLHVLAGPSIKVKGRRWVVHLSVNSVDQIIHALEWFGISPENNGDTSHFEPLPVDSVAPNNMAITTLEFSETYRSHINLEHLAPFLDLPLITSIKGTSLLSPRLQRSLLSYLSSPQATTQPPSAAVPSPELENHSAKTWAFPNLRELILQVPEDDVLKAVIDCVKSRSGNNAAPGVQGRPARLKRIKFVDAGDKAIQNGEHQLICDLKQVSDRWNLLLELLEVLDEDAEVLWCGERVSKL